MARRRRTVLALAAAGLVLVADGTLRPSAAPSPLGQVRDTPALVPLRSTLRGAPRVASGSPTVSPAADVGAPATPRPARPVAGRTILFGLPGGLPSELLPGTPGEAARSLLARHRSSLGLDDVPGELRVASERTGLMGHHLRLRQFVEGVEVDGSEVAVHVGVDVHRRPRPLLLAADVFPIAGVATSPGIPSGDVVALVRDLLVDAAEPAGDDDDDDGHATIDHREPVLAILPERRDDGTFGRLVWRVDASTPDDSVRVCVDAHDGGIVEIRDLRRAAEAVGKARVFRPNPVYASRNSAFFDRKDATSPQIEAWMEEVDLPRLDGTGRVRGRWCDAARGRGDAVNASLDWRSLTRTDPAFETVNAYFHVDRVQEELQRLGFTDVNAEAQRVSAHHLTQDQSYFDEYSDELRFGDGGVDDAEDGDVVVHELGHAIQSDMVPGFGATPEGRALGEGFSDFLACALHADPAAPDPEWDPLVASWDATSYSTASPPYLRRTDRSKVFPGDYTDEPHADGEIWSRFLWDLRDRLGHDDGLRVAVGSHAYMSAGARFRDAANAVLVANFHLREGRDDPAIRTLLRARGIPFSQPPLDAPPEDVYDTARDNDRAEDAAPLGPGAYSNLLLADEDWYRVAVPPFRRLRVQADFDPRDLDLDLELRTLAGTTFATSRGVSGQESAAAVAGADGATFLVRAFHGGDSVTIDGYSLLVQFLDLETAAPGRTTLRRAPPEGVDALSFSVGPEKVAAGRILNVRSLRTGAGARNDVRVVTPSGVVVADFGDGRTARGANVSVDATETGLWRIEIRARDGTRGAYTLRARFRKAR